MENNKCNKIKELSTEYKNSCNKSCKKELQLLLENFIDSNSLDSSYKEKILMIIVNLLTLK